MYTQVSAGHCHAVLLRSDGTAVACGQNFAGQCDIPPLEEGRSYTQVSAGGEHTVLLRDDGRAVTCGSNGYGQCDIPVLEETVSYIQVSAGLAGTVLIRSDGSAVACGSNMQHNNSIPAQDSIFGLSGFVASLLHHLQSPGFVMLAATISSLSPRVAIGFCNCNVWMRESFNAEIVQFGWRGSVAFERT